MNNKEYDCLDIINLLGTILGILNYNENLSQSTFQKATRKQTEEIHRHLQEQDNKIDQILERLKNDKN